MAYTFLLRNTPAFAYSSKFATLLSCNLVIKYSTSRKQAAIIVSLPTHIAGFDDAQLFDLVYNADDLVSGRTFLGPGPDDLSQSQLATITRRNDVVAVKTIHLALQTSCLVRCPPSTGCVIHKPGHDDAFRQLRNLASSTEVHIVFDANWVHEQHYAMFYRLINHPDRFGGIPTQNYKGPLSRQTDWTVFSPLDDVESEAPPSYHDVPAKRSRQYSPSPRLPPAKRERVLKSPEPYPGQYPFATSALFSDGFVGSPTEKATTTTASPSPRPPFSPYKNRPDTEDAMKSALEALLPEALNKMMPDVLARAFAVPPAPTQGPIAAGSIGSLISTQIAADVEGRLKPLHIKTIEEACTNMRKEMSTAAFREICAQSFKELHKSTLDDALDLRNAADVEFHEELHDHKLDLKFAKEDGLEELRRECDSKLGELVTTAAEIVVRSGAEVQGHADEVYLDVWKRLSRTVSIKEELFLQQIQEKMKLEQKRHSEKGFASNTSPAGSGPRATSLPL